MRNGVKQGGVWSPYLLSIYLEPLIESINTFASHRLIFKEKNSPFLLENTSNLTHEFLYDKF